MLSIFRINKTKEKTLQKKTKPRHENEGYSGSCNKEENRQIIIPESVNYHFTRTCNYSCGFCFHTAKTSFNVPLDEAKKGLQMLVEEGMKKV